MLNMSEINAIGDIFYHITENGSIGGVCSVQSIVKPELEKALDDYLEHIIPDADKRTAVTMMVEEIISAHEEKGFTNGFRLGARLMCEVLSK